METPILMRKFEEALDFEEIWSRSRFPIDKSGLIHLSYKLKKPCIVGYKADLAANG
jgi:hypothetical protein